MSKKNTLVGYFRSRDTFTKISLVTLLVLAIVTPSVISNNFDIRQRAQINTNTDRIQFIDESGQAITQTSTPSVRIKLTSVWPAQAQVFIPSHKNSFSFVGTAYAQTETTSSIQISEHADFSDDVMTISPYSINPFITTYNFSDTPGTKTLYGKFKSSNGTVELYSASITLVSPQ